MYLGKRIKGCKTMIFDSTLKDVLSESVGTLAIYEIVIAHLMLPDQMLTNNVSQLDILIREKELINHVLKLRGDNIVLNERLNTVDRNIVTVMDRLPTFVDLMERDFTCDFRKLYEVTVMNLKNRLVALQNKRILERNEERDGILNRIQYMEHKFGANSVQTNDEKEKLLRFDDAKLKEKAIIFRDFLDANNEKATKVFCKLSKDGGLCDDQEVIRDSNGEGFGDPRHRTEYIRRYYEGVYKKRLDNLLSIEEFLGGGGMDQGWVENRKLTNQESLELEGEVTMEELNESLNNSNFGSTSGWDGISFCVIRYYWSQLKHLIRKMTMETFREG
jgi:hypothetical protein